MHPTIAQPRPRESIVFERIATMAVVVSEPGPNLTGLASRSPLISASAMQRIQAPNCCNIRFFWICRRHVRAAMREKQCLPRNFRGLF